MIRDKNSLNYSNRRLLMVKPAVVYDNNVSCLTAITHRHRELLSGRVIANYNEVKI